MRYKTLIFIAYIIGFHTTTYAQYTIDSKYIPDSEFLWTKNSPLKSGGTIKPIFKKVEVDPIISEYSIDEFRLFLIGAIKNLKLDNAESGVVKLKLHFLENSSLQTENIGIIDINLSERQIRSLANQFNTIKSITRGKQRGVDQDSIGILYIFTYNGKLDRFRNVNFGFRED